MYKVNDYEKEDFKRITNKDGLNTYFIKVNRIYVEVDKEIYLTCLRSYMKIKYKLLLFFAKIRSLILFIKYT